METFWLWLNSISAALVPSHLYPGTLLSVNSLMFPSLSVVAISMLWTSRVFKEIFHELFFFHFTSSKSKTKQENKEMGLKMLEKHVSFSKFSMVEVYRWPLFLLPFYFQSRETREIGTRVVKTEMAHRGHSAALRACHHWAGRHI